MLYHEKPLLVTLDSGATTSYIKLSAANFFGLDIAPNNKLAMLADQQTRMASLGEVDFNVTIGNVLVRIRALVMKNLQAQCFGGTTFHMDNDVQTKIRDGTVTIHGRYTVDQSNPHGVTHVFPPPIKQISSPMTPELSDPGHEKLAVPEHGSSSNYALSTISLPDNAITYPSEFLSIPLPQCASHM